MSTLTFLTITILTIVLFKFVIWFKKNHDFHKKLATIPGPKQVFLLGNALDFKSTNDLLVNLMKYQKDHGLTFKVQLGPDSYVFTADPKLIEVITTSQTQINKSVSYRFLTNWIGDGLISAKNPRWKNHRRLITPTFHFNILKDFLPIFHKNANALVAHWKLFNGKEIDIYEDVLACALDVICETAMGISVNALKDGKRSNYTNSVKFMGRNLMERTFSFWKQFDALYKLSPDYKKEMEMVSYMKKTTEEVIQRKKEEMRTNALQKQPADADDVGTKTRVAFLDHLMASLKQNDGFMSDEDLREEVDTFIFAGHDTTASGTSFTLYHLAEHQDVQKKVYDEIMQVLGGDDEISYDKLPNLKYLEMVIKETMRITPTVPFYIRKLSEDIHFNGQILPKDLNVTVFAYGAHRNEQVFDKPDEFRPERFTLEASAKRSNFAYVPFSAGPRNCIGQKFAMVEMKCLLATLVKQFQFTKSPQFCIQPAAHGVLKSLNGIHLTVQLRNTK